MLLTSLHAGCARYHFLEDEENAFRDVANQPDRKLPDNHL